MLLHLIVKIVENIVKCYLVNYMTKQNIFIASEFGCRVLCCIRYSLYMMVYIIYIYIIIINNKIRFGNCLGEGRSIAYQVFHPFMITYILCYIVIVMYIVV